MKAALLLAWMAGGCSLFVVHGPPTAEEQANEAYGTAHTCTDSLLGPVVDTVIAAGYGLAALIVYEADRSGNLNDDAGGVIALSLTSALFAGVAIWGYSKVDDCHEYYERMNAKTREFQPAP